MKVSEWIDRLISSTGKFMQLETTDGVVREGRISGFTFYAFELNNDRVEIPIEIEMNGDPNDRIPLNRIGKMTVD